MADPHPVSGDTLDRVANQLLRQPLPPADLEPVATLLNALALDLHPFLAAALPPAVEPAPIYHAEEPA